MPAQHHLLVGADFPEIELPTIEQFPISLASPGWRAIFVVRGAHCGICRNYLQEIEQRRRGWEEKGIEVVSVSADPAEKAAEFAKVSGFGGISAFGLGVDDMQALGLWMTGPEHSNLDHVHAEPAFFLVDPEGRIAAIDISTLPAIRPDLEQLDNGFDYIIQNDIRPPFGSYEVQA